MKSPFLRRILAVFCCVLLAGCTAAPSSSEEASSSEPEVTTSSEVSSAIPSSSGISLPESSSNDETPTSSVAPESSSAPVPSQPQVQYFDKSLLTNGSSGCGFYVGDSLYIISYNYDDAASRMATFFALLPLNDLVVVDAPANFNRETAIELSGRRFEYTWYIQPDFTCYIKCTVLDAQTIVEDVVIYTTSSQELYDTINNMPTTNPELFDGPIKGSYGDNGEFIPNTG